MDLSNKIRQFLFENKVVLMFLIITLGAFFVSGMSTVAFFDELFVRFGRNAFLVLALLIPVVSGLGLNFGIVIGAMSGQMAVFFIVLWGGSGVMGVFMVAALATPIAIALGFIVGKLFNSMKGSEMIGGMVANLFFAGFYQFFFLFVMGGVIPIANQRLMTPTGVGVLNAINIGDSPTYMRQALDNVSMLEILLPAFFIMLAFNIIVIGLKLYKKEPIKLMGKDGVIKPLSILIILGIAYGLIFVWEDFLVFLYQNRLNGVYASRIVAVGLLIYYIQQIIAFKSRNKTESIPKKYFAYISLVIIGFAITLTNYIALGLGAVRIPVFTFMIIAALCFFINWFLTTRLGQNMRTVGHDRNVATAAGINVDRTRIIAMMMSTVLAAWGQIIALQSFGMMNTYGAHEQVALYSIAALLIGGATVSKASVKHAIVGVLLFHGLFILAPLAGIQIMGSALIGEYFRMIVANAVIAMALIMHAWKKIPKKKVTASPELAKQ